MFTFWRKPNELIQPLVQPQQVITVHHRHSLFDKIKKKMEDVDLRLATDSTLLDQEKSEKRCKAVLFTVPTITSAATIGLIVLIVNQYLKAAQATFKYNNDIWFDNATCAKALDLSSDDDFFCIFPDNDDYPISAAFKACLPLMYEMCATENYSWLIAVTILLALASGCCFYGISQDEIQTSYATEIEKSLTFKEKKLLQHLGISWNISSKESLEALDKLIQTKIILPFPDVIFTLIDEYLLPEAKQDVFAKVAIEAARQRIR